jgi:hypothetical protein
MRGPEEALPPPVLTLESELSFEGVPSAFFDITMQAKTNLHDMSGGQDGP